MRLLTSKNGITHEYQRNANQTSVKWIIHVVAARHIERGSTEQRSERESEKRNWDSERPKVNWLLPHILQTLESIIIDVIATLLTQVRNFWCRMLHKEFPLVKCFFCYRTPRQKLKNLQTSWVDMGKWRHKRYLVIAP